MCINRYQNNWLFLSYVCIHPGLEGALHPWCSVLFVLIVSSFRKPGYWFCACVLVNLAHTLLTQWPPVIFDSFLTPSTCVFIMIAQSRRGMCRMPIQQDPTQSSRASHSWFGLQVTANSTSAPLEINSHDYPCHCAANNANA